MLKAFLLLSFYTSLAVGGLLQSSRLLQRPSSSNSCKYNNDSAVYEYLFSLIGLEQQRNSTSKFLDEDSLGIPRNFLSFFSNKFFSSNSSDGSERKLERRIAECTLTNEDKDGVTVRTLYLPLKDAEEYAKRIENAKEGTQIRRFSNKTDDESEADANIKVDFKCKTITIDDDTKKCSTCVYSEVMVPRRHMRFGHFGPATILECINGYDNNLGSSERPYFVQEVQNYHPICLA
ncbi:hypothetical protein BEWA_031970 [Theileria equi strain WA]|uniref:Signal peptide-containing protein n=1 Tax=Theileria equi strain WA TaxID=1537102 RepID=L0AZM6_THEEQ|nr:hypothetical protein BEWA_031970 [Theileria equi strain WA]AFZ80344.1 hypothetical protein BEWA_031970 [Theileria equi strain WA]|eukprot:XP_004830010.1 hypothetical protein BEWA_031970 [Theileria equi strain WA]